MGLKNQLTVEKLRKKFKSSFDLVSYSIKLTKNIIDTGRRPRVTIKSDNPARIALEEIAAGVDTFEEVVEEQADEMILAQQGLESVKAAINDDDTDTEEDDTEEDTLEDEKLDEDEEILDDTEDDIEDDKE
ncbi:MAG: DNA-directed RNA polymerase subunit omega [Waddliaceae bacterium]|jgi:DNA-directed RNA polymerase omega subunit|nr:DNA-directed RNA polymerase subunit omega [Waddliaceae bacterium]MBT3579224.1 DNA-directed RNA polymerase subunit omega [Waddliaceae bacterium]MBT4444276.1 DNA-directed RNA polymerase subunit omega [Waddliaceae bacterium]MBT6928923.1 DNA-directed RNA polymerase subunit omega [Waddliaceae bacterium]MBT7264170.1 DNA-directed RNA polymerase subunit omega [Waddliaceae bacterium]